MSISRILFPMLHFFSKQRPEWSSCQPDTHRLWAFQWARRASNKSQNAEGDYIFKFLTFLIECLVFFFKLLYWQKCCLKHLMETEKPKIVLHWIFFLFFAYFFFRMMSFSLMIICSTIKLELYVPKMKRTLTRNLSPHLLSGCHIT